MRPWKSFGVGVVLVGALAFVPSASAAQPLTDPAALQGVAVAMDTYPECLVATVSSVSPRYVVAAIDQTVSHCQVDGDGKVLLEQDSATGRWKGFASAPMDDGPMPCDGDEGVSPEIVRDLGFCQPRSTKRLAVSEARATLVAAILRNDKISYTTVVEVYDEKKQRQSIRCRRTHSTTVRCNISYFIGDAVFKGSASVVGARSPLGWKHYRVSWTVRHTDEYCKVQRHRQNKSTRSCSKTYKKVLNRYR